MNFINNINLVRTVCRYVLDIFPEFPHLIHTVVWCTVNFKDIGCISGSDLPAGPTGIAGHRPGPAFTVHGLCQNTRNRCFAGSSWSGKKDGMGNASGWNGVTQGARYVVLLYDLVKCLRSVFSGKDKIGHKRDNLMYQVNVSVESNTRLMLKRKALGLINLWRRERDSNPRYLLQHTRFPVVHLQPLGHLSAKRQTFRQFVIISLLYSW